MARARNLKPGFFKNEDLAECSYPARLCFAGLWTLADREGRLEDRPKRIKGELFAFDSIEVEPLLKELVRRGFLLRYEAEGAGYIQVLQFAKHQNPHHKEPKSVIPSPQSLGLLPHATDEKPEAQEPSEDGETLDKPGASPGFSGQQADLPRGVNRADSLFSDSPSHKTEDPEERAGACDETEVVGDAKPTRAGELCRLFKAEGVQATNPGHPDLLALIAAGVTDDEIRGAARAALGKGDPFAYALVALTKQRQRAAATPLHVGPLPTVGAVAAVTVPRTGPDQTAAYLAKQSEHVANAKPPPASLAELRQRLAERKLG